MSRRLATRVLVTGPDGAGKTLVASSALRALRSGGVRVTHVHFQPLHAADTRHPPVTPHEERVRGSAATALVLASRAVKYLASWAKGPLAGRNRDLVLQERGWFDQQIDPIRYRNASSMTGLIGLLGAIQPSFDLHCLLEGDARDIQRRKPELSVAEVDRQMLAWHGVGRSRRRVALTTTGCEPEAVIARLCAEIRDARRSLLERSTHDFVGAPSRLEACGTENSSIGFRAMYRPLSRTGLLARDLGLLRPIGRVSSGIVPSRAAWAISQLNLPADAFAAIRSTGRDRVVAATIVSGEIVSFIKVGSDDDQTMFEELRALTSIGPIPGLRLPRVQGHYEGDGLIAIALAPLAGANRAPEVDHEAALRAAVALRWARSGQGVTHGDLAPWNLLAGSPPGLVDWESYEVEFRPGYDLAHYLSVSGTKAKSPLAPWVGSWREWPIWSAYAAAARVPIGLVLEGAEPILGSPHANN